MPFRVVFHRVLSLVCAVALAACGGGGGGGNDKTVGSTQQTAQEIYAASSGGIYFLSLRLPTTAPLDASRDYAVAVQYSTSDVLSEQPQILQRAEIQIAGTAPKPLPGMAQRTLVNGAFYEGFSYSNPQQITERLGLIGNDVLWEEVFTADGVRRAAGRYTAIEKIPLVGTIAATPSEVRDQSGINSLLSLPGALKPGASYLPGAMYFKRTSITEGDFVTMDDCGALVLVAPPLPTPCGNFSRLEDVFPNGGLAFSNGSIQTLQGLRAWVENRSTGTPLLAVFIERGGRVYRGTLLRSGRQSTSIRFNKQAVDSVKAAVAF